MKNKREFIKIAIFFLLVSCTNLYIDAQSYQEQSIVKNRISPLTREFLTPKRIVWTSDNFKKLQVLNAEAILREGADQADLNSGKYLGLLSDSTKKAGIVLDFGAEINGAIQIITTVDNSNPAGRIRVRFGESVSETMSEIGKNGATNDHAIRDQIITLPWLGKSIIGESGFRFVRIDVVDPNVNIEIKEISAISTYRDIPYLGSFKCNDEKLNKIWITGARTVHLNMQDYLWDGVKRDRLVWVGDLHPEIMTILSVFGTNDVVTKSLDLARNVTPLPAWFNGISSYSMWWMLIQKDWYQYSGDLEYLKLQQPYMGQLLLQLSKYIDKNGKEILDGTRFLDWPSSINTDAIHAGLQSLMVMTFNAGEELSKVLGDKKTEDLCRISLEKLKRHVPALNESKQAAALLSLSNLIPSEVADKKVLAQNGVHGMSTFYGYYMLEAMAKAQDYQGAIDDIRTYWGAMLDLGATTFWEDFNIDWIKNAGRIDEIVPEGKVDVHKEYGGYCYTGFRHSFCHGWSSGPTAWMSRYILGVTPVKAGFRQVRINPHLGDLKWVEGSFPTPYGLIKIKHTRQSDGTVKSDIEAPKDIEIIK